MHSPILGGFSVSRSTDASDNDIYNLYAEIQETKDGRAPGALYMCPGLDALSYPTTTTSQYCANPVVITKPTQLNTPVALVGLQATFPAFVFSNWLLATDDAGVHGLIFTNQVDETLGSHNPGLFIEIANDQTATPQITVKAWDVSNAAIVSATYNFTTWAAWVNVQISLDTVTQKLQVYASTIVASVLVESALTPVALTWSSTNPIANPSATPWRVLPVPA